MKITQNENEMIIGQSATSSLVASIIMIGLGVVMLIAGLIGGNWILAAIGLGMAAVAGAILFFAKSQVVTLRKGGPSTLSQKKVIGGSATSREFATASIVNVFLVTGMDAQGGSSNSRSSTLGLSLSDNSRIILAEDSGRGGVSVGGVNISGFLKASLSDEAKQVSEFLGVPLSAYDNSNPINAIKGIAGAIKEGITQAQVPQAPQPQQPQMPPAPGYQQPVMGQQPAPGMQPVYMNNSMPQAGQSPVTQQQPYAQPPAYQQPAPMPQSEMPAFLGGMPQAQQMPQQPVMPPAQPQNPYPPQGTNYPPQA